MKIIAIVAAAVFCLALATGIVLAVIGLDSLETLFWGNGEMKYQGKEQTIEATGLDAIFLDAGAAEVIVQRSERSDVGLSYSANWPVDEAAPPVTVSSSEGTLTIRTHKNRVGIQFFRYTRVVRVVLDLPQEYSGALEAEVGAGSLFLSGRQNFRTLQLKVDAGQCQMEAIKAGQAELNVAAGHIQADRLDAEQLELTVGIGAAELGGLTGGASVEVSTGAAELFFDRMGGDIVCDVALGNAVLRLPADTGADVELSASLGGVEHTFGSRFSGEFRDGSLKGKLNSGGPRLSGSVSMGNIRLEMQ